MPNTTPVGPDVIAHNGAFSVGDPAFPYRWADCDAFNDIGAPEQGDAGPPPTFDKHFIVK